MKSKLEQIVEKYLIKDDTAGPFMSYNSTPVFGRSLSLSKDYAKANAGRTENDKARVMGYEITPDGLWKRIKNDAIDGVKESNLQEDQKESLKARIMRARVDLKKLKEKGESLNKQEGIKAKQKQIENLEKQLKGLS